MGNTCECTNNIEKMKLEVQLYFGDEGEPMSPTQTKAPNDSKVNI